MNPVTSKSALYAGALSGSVRSMYRRDTCPRYRIDIHVSDTEQCWWQVNSKHNSATEDSVLLGFHTVSIGAILPTFRKIVVPLNLQSRSLLTGITGLLYSQGEFIIFIRRVGELLKFRKINNFQRISVPLSLGSSNPRKWK